MTGRAVVDRPYRQSLFDFGGNRWSRAAAKVRFYLEAVKGRWIMTCRDHDTAHEFPSANFKRNVRSRVRPVQHDDAKTVGCDDLGRGFCECLRLESHIEPDENGSFTTLDGLEVFGCGLRSGADVFERKCVRNDGTPSIGSKLNGTLHNDEKSVTTLLSPSTTPARRFADRPI